MRHIRVQAASWRSSLQAIVPARGGVHYSSTRGGAGRECSRTAFDPGRGGFPGPGSNLAAVVLAVIIPGVFVLAIVGPAVPRLVFLAVLVVILEGAERAADVRQDRVARLGVERAQPRAVRSREPLRRVDVQGDVARRAAELEAGLVLQLGLQRGRERKGCRVDGAFDQDGGALVHERLEI